MALGQRRLGRHGTPGTLKPAEATNLLCLLWLGFLFWKEEYLRKKQKMKWEDIQKEVKTMEGKRPKSDKPVRNAVTRVSTAGAKCIAMTMYHNCGRRYGEDGGKYLITPRQEKEVVNFVKMWRKMRFCTCKYIRRELKLEATPRTIARALNRNGYHWCQVSKKMPLTPKQ